MLNLWAAMSGIQARKIRILAPNLAETKPGDSWRSYRHLLLTFNAAFPNSIDLRFICIYRIPPPAKPTGAWGKNAAGHCIALKDSGGHEYRRPEREGGRMRETDIYNVAPGPKVAPASIAFSAVKAIDLNVYSVRVSASAIR